MKKIFLASLALALIVTGCGPKEEVKTEAELRAEIKAEFEAEMAANTVGDTGSTVEEEKQEEKQEEEVVESQPNVNMIDLKDKALLISYIKENYPKADYFDELTIKYHDVNRDGQEDAICYFENYRSIGRPVILFDDGGQLKEIENDMGFHYTQDISFDEDFIFNRVTGGGTGIHDEFIEIYAYKDGGLVYTDASILIEGRDAGPNVMNERTGKVTFLEGQGNYKHYKYDEVQTGTSVYTIEREYVYDPSSFKFNINEMKNTRDHEVTTAHHEEFPRELNGHKVIEAKQTQKEFYLKMDGIYENVPGTVSYSELEEEHVFCADPSYYEGMDCIKVVFENETFNIVPPEGPITISESSFYNLSGSEVDQAVMKMDRHEAFDVVANLSNYETGIVYQSEGGSGADIEIIALKKDGVEQSVSGQEERYDVSLEHLENEKLFSEGEEILIDYSKYSLVMIPTQVSKNIEGYKTRSIDVTSTGREQHYMLTVHGTLITPKVIYRANALDPDSPDIEIEIGDKVENEILIIHAEMPTDTSAFSITGLYQIGSALEGPVRVSFDDGRDPEFNKIVRIQGYSFPEENY